MANASKSSSKLRILYAEGNSEVLATQSVTLEKAGYDITQAEGRQFHAGLEDLQRDHHDRDGYGGRYDDRDPDYRSIPE